VQPLPKDRSQETPSVDDQNKTFRRVATRSWLSSDTDTFAAQNENIGRMARFKVSVLSQSEIILERLLTPRLIHRAALAIAIITSSGFDQTHDQAKDCFGDKATDNPANADAECAQRGARRRK
jgi:hypothetical protein